MMSTVFFRYHICERPSLKNFYASEESEPIFYSTGEVCKADSQSTLSILDPHDKADNKMTLDENKIKTIIRVLRNKIGLLLAGFDVVIDNTFGHHAVIDINVFPSYDHFPNFFEHLLDCIDESVNKTSNGDSCYGNISVESENDYICNYTPNGLVNVGRNQHQLHVTGMNIN